MSSSVDVPVGNAAAAGEPRRPGRQRAGGRILTLLAVPLNVHILRALAERPMRLADLRKAAGLPAQTTLRGHLSTLSELGALAKRPTQRMPYAVENELTPMGHDLLAVADVLEAWLRNAPEQPIALDSGLAKGAVKALVDGWTSRMLRALAARPLALTELDSLISDLSYPALERRLSSMRMAGLVEPQPGRGAGTPYAVTAWARRGTAALAAGSHCERTHMGKSTPPVTPIDVEAAFLLATPLVGLRRDVAGSCQLEVTAPRGDGGRACGVRVEVEGGRVVSCVSRLEPRSGAWAAGSKARWFNAVNGGNLDQLRFGGGRELAVDVVSGLHAALASA